MGAGSTKGKKTREASFWGRVRDSALGRLVHMERIENGVSSGHPDVDYLCPAEPGRASVAGKVELKSVGCPARGSTPPLRGSKGLRPSQVAWFQKYMRLGGRAWVLAKVGDRLYLLPGQLAPTLHECPLAELHRQAAWSAHGAVKEHQWAELAEVLRGMPALRPEGLHPVADDDFRRLLSTSQRAMSR